MNIDSYYERAGEDLIFATLLPAFLRSTCNPIAASLPKIPVSTSLRPSTSQPPVAVAACVRYHRPLRLPAQSVRSRCGGSIPWGQR
jgi:hypothetical protein